MFMMLLVALSAWPQDSAATVVRCRFTNMPPMVLTFYGGMRGTLKVGKSAPVPLAVGSSLSTASYGAQELTFSLRLPASVTVSAPGNDTLTYNGQCVSGPPH